MESKLQIISGTYRGRKLHLPPLARPTQNMARGAIFNMLAGILSPNDKMFVWDAFAAAAGGNNTDNIHHLRFTFYDLWFTINNV